MQVSSSGATKDEKAYVELKISDGPLVNARLLAHWGAIKAGKWYGSCEIAMYLQFCLLTNAKPILLACPHLNNHFNPCCSEWTLPGVTPEGTRRHKNRALQSFFSKVLDIAVPLWLLSVQTRGHWIWKKIMLGYDFEKRREERQVRYQEDSVSGGVGSFSQPKEDLSLTSFRSWPFTSEARAILWPEISDSRWVIYFLFYVVDGNVESLQQGSACKKIQKKKHTYTF